MTCNSAVAEVPCHPSDRRVLYPGNLVGFVHAPGDAEAMKRLLHRNLPGWSISSIGHYDGSVSLFPPASFFFYLNAHPTDDSWAVHGFVNGGLEEVNRAAVEVAPMFDAIGIRTELAYVPE